MKTKSKIFLVSGMAVIFAAIVALTVFSVLFFNAKPVFVEAIFRPLPEKTIIACTFDGMTFEPAANYAARNYSKTDNGFGGGSSISTMYNTVNEKIERSLAEYLDGRYNEYFIKVDIDQNTHEKSVLRFSGDAVPIDGGERKIVEFKLTIDWNNVIENNGDNFIEITTKLPYEEA